MSIKNEFIKLENISANIQKSAANSIRISKINSYKKKFFTGTRLVHMQRYWVDRCTHTNMKKFTFNENFSIFIFASSNICTTVCSINSILWANFLIKLFFSMPDFFIFTNMCNYRRAMEWSIWDFFVWILHSMKSVVLKCDGRVKLRNYAS